MRYISVRGNLGGNYTQVNELPRDELDLLSSRLRRGPKAEEGNEVAFYNPVDVVINELESSLGYEVVSSTNTTSSQSRFPDVTMWVMCKNPFLPHSSARS